jgi:RNA polymerase sigma-70 factor (ECF subfamily)
LQLERTKRCLLIHKSYEEKELLSRLAEGDEFAFKELYNNHWNRLYSFALSWLKNIAQAEDAVQESFLKIWISRDRLDTVQNIENYLFITCRNTVIGLMEKNAVRLRSGMTVSEEVDPLSPDAILQFKEMRDHINILVEKLPPQQRQIFRMSREQGLSHEEIACQLGIMKETVKNHMVRALNTLRSQCASPGTLLLLWFWMIEQGLKK